VTGAKLVFQDICVGYFDADLTMVGRDMIVFEGRAANPLYSNNRAGFTHLYDTLR
jgi:aldehyde:ferredoxin oxidoreductase